MLKSNCCNLSGKCDKTPQSEAVTSSASVVQLFFFFTTIALPQPGMLWESK